MIVFDSAGMHSLYRLSLHLFMYFTFCLGPACSCRIIDLSQNDIFTTSPEKEYEILDAADNVSISFSEKVERSSVESIAGILRNNEKTEIRYIWEDDSTVVLQAADKQYRGIQYQLEFKGIYRNHKGDEKEADISIPFYRLSRDFTSLKVIDSFPIEGSRLDSQSPVQITFNKSVDSSTFRDALKISPSIETDISWTGTSGCTVKIDPLEDWTNLENYRICIDEKLSSTKGEPLIPNWETRFYVEDGTTQPAVQFCGTCSKSRQDDFPWKATDLNSLKASDALRISFTEVMDHSSTEAAFSLSPALAGELYWIDENLVFSPEESFAADVVYRIKIDSTALSKNKIGIKEQFVLDFESTVEPVRLNSLECSSMGGFILNEFSDIEACDLPVLPVSPFDLSFHLTFSCPFSHEEEKQNVQDSLSFHELFSSGGSPEAGLFSWINDYSMTVIYSGFTADTESDYYYLMELEGGSQGIVGSEGNIMEKTVSQLFRMAKQ